MVVPELYTWYLFIGGNSFFFTNIFYYAILTNNFSYFSRYALELFRGNTHISKYINWPILEKYYPVGGVRIEDDILVTEDGYENLTTAPKGQAALDIINGREEEEKEDVVEEKIEKRKGWFW